MRKIYIILSVFLFSLFVSSVNAQVGTYIFTSSAGTYTPLAGATTSTATGDDGTQNVAIGFNFIFGGVSYSNAVISTNGAIKLATDGATGFGTSWFNNLSNGYGAAIIGAIWDDNRADGGSISYLTTGSAPTRTFSVEWTNIHLGGSGSTTTPTGTFKLTLAESNGSVTIQYGTIGSMASSSAGIGLNDLTSFNSVTPGAPATASSTVANNNIASATNLTSGTTYTFLIPPPCVAGSLNGGTTQSTLTAACGGVPFDLSVTGASFGTGLTFQWQFSADGVTNWQPVPSGTTAIVSVTQTAATFYRRRMTCSGTDAFSTVIQVTQNAILDCYCVPAFPSNVEPITLVNFSNINNATSAAVNGTPPLENFTAIVGNVSKGQTYPIRVKGNTDGGFTTQINVYIDWNQNGSFGDLGESYYIGPITNSTGLDAVEATANILIPPTSLDGTTRMRVIKKYNAQAPACNTDGFGQAEDYTLSITTPLCIAPSAVSVNTIGTTTASVSFTATGTAYVEYGPPGFTPGTGAAAGVGGTVVSGPSAVALSGLTANTLYDVYVRQDCGGGIFSGNAIGGNFRTLCNPITSYPYTETFEAASTTRPCWSTQVTSGTVNWTYGAGAGNGGSITAAHTGALNARHFGGGTGDEALLISPQLNLTSMPPALGAQLTFWYANQDWFGDQNELRVYYKTSAGGTWTLIPGAVYTTSVGAWTEVELILPSSTGSDYYIAFEGIELFGRGVAIDDVTIAPAPSCPKPTLVSALGISPTQMVVNFTSPGSAFVIEYGPVGFVPGTTNAAGAGTVAFTATSPYTISGLTPGFAYDVYVRRICTPGSDYSLNVKTTASTLCAATNVPYLQTFESAIPPGGLPTCTSMQDLNGNSGPDPNVSGGRWTTFAGTSTDTYVSPVNVARYLYDAQNPARGADDWLYMQGLNLTGGTSYRLKFFYKASDGPTFIEQLEVKFGQQAINTAMTNTIYTNTNINTAIASPWDSATVDFTPATTGVYYVGFHALSDPDQAFLYIDNVSVKVTPLVDAGVTAAVVPTCPATSGIVNATIRNYNITPLNFATYPVTVTATITGASAGSVSTTVNTGTLAPGTTLSVPLPAFNFISGSYSITVATSSVNDPEPGNDSYTTSFFVNPSPTVAVITPAAPAICAGIPVQLNTQFVTPPANPVTLPVIASGTIAVAVPDASATGVSHTLAVAGVPAGATITAISVSVNVTHTWINDIVVNLTAPNGRVLNLFNRKGAAAQANITNMVISSTSSAPIPGTAPFTGTFAPDAGIGVGPTTSNSDAASFADLLAVANGNWSLSLRDYALFDVGTLTSWSITVTYAFPHPNVTWTPVTGLFTNAAGTAAYAANANAYSVYANPAGTTTYTATSTNPITGCTSTKTVTVTVNSNPVINILPLPAKICLSDELVSLSATPAGGTWSGIGVSGNNFVPPATALGNFTLTYSSTNAQGCTSTKSTIATVQDCPERIILLRDNAVILYPNPSNGQFNIRMNSVLYNRLSMRVYSNAGALVSTKEFSGLAFGRVVPINLTYLPAGSYMVELYYIGGVRTEQKTFKVLIGH